MKEKFLVAGGVLSALAASTCCIVPLALVSLGVGGAWVGSLHALAPYQPVFVIVAIAFLGTGFWLGYRRSGESCGTGTCPDALSAPFIKSFIWIKTLLWIAATLVVLTLGANYPTPFFF